MEGDIEDAEGMETERRHALLAQLQTEQHVRQQQNHQKVTSNNQQIKK